MTENQPKQQTGFLGAYFDRSSILWFSKTANLFAWIVLIYHLGQAVLALGIMTLQIVRGLVFLSGFTDYYVAITTHRPGDVVFCGHPSHPPRSVNSDGC